MAPKARAAEKAEPMVRAMDPSNAMKASTTALAVLRIRQRLHPRARRGDKNGESSPIISGTPAPQGWDRATRVSPDSHVGGVLYRSDGSKNGERWVLRPINEVQAVEASVPINNTLKLSNGQYSGAAQVDLGVRPYDRIVQISFTVW